MCDYKTAAFRYEKLKVIILQTEHKFVCLHNEASWRLWRAGYSWTATVLITLFWHCTGIVEVILHSLLVFREGMCNFGI